MMNDEIVSRGLYAPFAHDANGRVLDSGLSFRVSLLPYVEEANLYQKFDLSKSWDSPGIARTRTPW